MKHKKLLIYAGIVALIILTVYFTAPDTGKQISGDEMKNMPEEFPSGHPPVSQGSPNKSNVNAEVFQKIEQLKKAVENSPGDTVKIKEYADILSASHQIEEAKTNYLKVLESGPDRTDILESLTNIYFISGDYRNAEIYNSKILKINKNNRTAIYNAGAIAATTGNLKKAKEFWQNLVQNFKGTDEAELAEKSLAKL